ncbi:MULTISPECIES: RelA/SpoT family protein [Methylomonas]|uniref:RelA/SpoT family protein n=1 Tax=Methylomonas TaxID=416 RepID=UPI0012320830|nr:bifunctional (p)ppGpp synthetase/guanosine-3',5'-bis(diphosphate) 3'-pyrophosphohydrolase [Methylomonas rhizoryzae]
MHIPDIVTRLFPDLSAPDLAQIKRALALTGQTEASAADVNLRPRGIDVAAILSAVHIDLPTILAALLSDSQLENKLSEADIETEFDQTVAQLVKDVRWLNTVSIYKLDMAEQPDQAEILRRMLLAMTHDVRAVLIKLAYRIQRLRGLARESEQVRRFIATETLDIYAPLANRLGISQFKWELEDLAFRYLKPEQYKEIAAALAEKRGQRESCIQAFLSELESSLRQHQIEAKVYGRPKHIYSIWRKMLRKRLPIQELYDLLAVRVIVGSLADCYAALGVAHSQWQTIPKEFDDYIANPKENGYQSLHTVVLDKQGNRIEIQIRTKAMHEFAELGVAAHWRYKEGGKHNLASERNIASLRMLLEERNNDHLLANFRTELFSDRVFVLTPSGQLIDLVKGATPLDFAYAIHTEVGHSCRGAKVNGHIKPLTYPLQSGEQVEIIAVKNGHPNRNWLDSNLGYLKTPRAISKVKAWFKQQEFSENIAAGKSLLDKECKRLGIKQPDLPDLLKHFKMADAEHFYQALGRGDINTRQLAGALKIPELAPLSFKLAQPRRNDRSTVTVADLDNVVTSLAHCCTPVNGDPIVAYVSHRRGITIHRRDCENIRLLNAEQRKHLLEAEWSGNHKAHHTVTIIIEALEADHLLGDVSQLLRQAKIHVSEATLKTRSDLSATLQMQIRVESTGQLSQILGQIGQLSNVIEARRKI